MKYPLSCSTNPIEIYKVSNVSEVTEVVQNKSVNELDALIAAATAEKENAKVRALDEVNAKAAEFKVLCESLDLKPVSFFKSETPAKVYANPADASQTFSGRGPRPDWLTQQLAGIEDKKAIKAKIAEFLVA